MQQRKEADELEALKALRVCYGDKPLVEAMEEANVSPELRQMFDQSEAVNQSEVQQQMWLSRVKIPLRVTLY